MNCQRIFEKHIALFNGIICPELESMLGCLGAKISVYRKGDYMLTAGSPLRHIGILLSGQAVVSRDDILGNRTVLAALSVPDLFGESLACAGVTVSPVNVEAVADTEILLISFDKIIRTCTACCTHHNALIKNMLHIVALKNLEMNEKLDHIARKTTRQKLASYLMGQAVKKKTRRFEIELDRQALADYLCVNRSALSRELSHISELGILSYNRNRFVIDDLARLKDLLESEQ
jgi:CRP-like cAMP-binding protein